MRVLIVKMSALGDIIHALPVLDYLTQVSPGIEIDWVVEEPFLDVLEGNPLVSRIHRVRTKVWRKAPLSGATIREIGALKRALRERAYDLVFDIQGNLKSGLVCWLSGAADRIGFDREVLQESVNLLFTTPADDAAADVLLSTLDDGLVFLFHCGTTWSTKFWFEEGWVALGRVLLDNNLGSSILLSWGNEAEKTAARSIATAIGSGARVIDRQSLKGFAALLKKVDLVIGGDTGPVHIAAAVDTPTVSLYRSSDGKRSGPRGKSHAIVQSPLHCAACFRTECDKDEACRRSITPEAVLNAVEKVLC